VLSDPKEITDRAVNGEGVWLGRESNERKANKAKKEFAAVFAASTRRRPQSLSIALSDSRMHVTSWFIYGSVEHLGRTV